MEKPTHMAVFDALYGVAAGEGREAVLFGNSIELARPAFERMLIGSGYPIVYLEFPLLGRPCFDLLAVHGGIEPGARFAPDAGFGRQPMYDWFSGLYGNVEVSCGLEVDCSTGQTDVAGVYLQHRGHDEFVEPFLESVGEGRRAASYEAIRARMPEGWPLDYVGLFPGREGSPMRVGGYLAGSSVRKGRLKPAALARTLDTVGFTAYDAPMLELCSRLMAEARSVDFQLDVMANGTLGNTFGLALSFNETTPREARACMSGGYGARFMQSLEEAGLADSRWRLIPGAAFARRVAYQREDGTEAQLALIVRLNFAKIKFRSGTPQPAKFYLQLQAAELQP